MVLISFGNPPSDNKDINMNKLVVRISVAGDTSIPNAYRIDRVNYQLLFLLFHANDIS